MPKLEVFLTKEEMADLEEIVQRGEAKDVADALKSMGLRTYRQLKTRADKERKEPSVDLSFEFLRKGFPTVIPCTLAKKLRRYKIPYLDFIFGASLLGSKRRGDVLVTSKEDCRRGAIRYLEQILKGKPETKKIRLKLGVTEAEMKERGVAVMAKKLSYYEFLKICWGGLEPRDAPLYRDIFVRLAMAKIIEPKGDLPSEHEVFSPSEQVTPFQMLEERMREMELRLTRLENLTTQNDKKREKERSDG